MNNNEDELIEQVLQKAWDRLLKLREEGKISTFDSAIPAQIAQWLDSIYNSQLGTLRAANQEMWKNKRFAIAIAYRMSIQGTIGLDYFMEQMNNTGKMNAIDKLIKDLESGLKKDNDLKRLFR